MNKYYLIKTQPEGEPLYYAGISKDLTCLWSANLETSYDYNTCNTVVNLHRILKDRKFFAGDDKYVFEILKVETVKIKITIE